MRGIQLSGWILVRPVLSVAHKLGKTLTCYSLKIHNRNDLYLSQGIPAPTVF